MQFSGPSDVRLERERVPGTSPYYAARMQALCTLTKPEVRWQHSPAGVSVSHVCPCDDCVHAFAHLTAFLFIPGGTPDTTGCPSHLMLGVREAGHIVASGIEEL